MGVQPLAGPEGFAAFVAARSGALLRTAVLLTADRHAAEDALQEALVLCACRLPGQT
ncbi:MAG TPA: hypothetical protein VNU66_11340 [Mycobacteriales bacterium]|nr:hypothetical protein [Mycobacteriales bacterium]